MAINAEGLLKIMGLGKPKAIAPVAPTVAQVTPDLAAGGAVVNVPAVQPVPEETILGLTPDQFSVVTGGLASALAPGSPQAEVGDFARALAGGGITAEAIGAPVKSPTLKEIGKKKKTKLEEIPSSTLDLSNTMFGR